MWQRYTATDLRNTAKSLPCRTARQTSHGLIAVGKEYLPCSFPKQARQSLCRVLSRTKHGKDLSERVNPHPGSTDLCRVLSLTMHGKLHFFAVIPASQARQTPLLCRVPFSATHGKLLTFAVFLYQRRTATLRTLPCAFEQTARQIPVAQHLYLAPLPCAMVRCTRQRDHMVSLKCQVAQVVATCGLCRVHPHGTGLCRVPCHGKVTIWPRFVLFLQKSLHFTDKTHNNSQMIILTQI